VQGCVVWKSYGTKVIENIMEILETFLDETGHSKTHFPLLIPENLFGKETRHLRGFENQIYWITKAGKRRLSRKLVIRPTSETAMYEMFSLWIRSHKDLPIKIYQTVSVFRYETKSTKPLIREREMWPFNEAHTAHATITEAKKQTKIGVQIYKKLFRRLALSYLLVQKPKWELFPGAINAFEFYTLMPDGKVLETGSVNNLGQAFSRVFNINFEKADGSHEYAYQTCYGQSERLLASIIVVHGDDHGLVLPTSIAPILVVIVPILYADTSETVIDYAKSIERTLKKRRFTVTLDLREETPGEKFHYWEKLGVPIRLEIGPKEVDSRTVTIVRRDTLLKQTVTLENLAEKIRIVFKEIDRNLWRRATQSLRERVTLASNLMEAIEQITKGSTIIQAFWCGDEECRHQVEEKTATETIGFSVGRKPKKEKCLICGKKARELICLAKSY
jgi:prolyl-tRNA synthetase